MKTSVKAIAERANNATKDTIKNVMKITNHRGMSSFLTNRSYYAKTLYKFARTIGEYSMEYVSSLLPTLWKIIEKKGGAINVSTIDNELVVSIIGKKRIKRFKSADSHDLITNINQYLQAC
ncbi:MAG TPA: hypothetical protein VK616_12620 [Flavitalea sp.]|nr:hypothetical protein [Flavitalea sp.]